MAPAASFPYEDVNGCALHTAARDGIPVHTDIQSSGSFFKAVCEIDGVLYSGTPSTTKKEAWTSLYKHVTMNNAEIGRRLIAGTYLRKRDIRKLPSPDRNAWILEAYASQHGYTFYYEEQMFGPPHIRQFAVYIALRLPGDLTPLKPKFCKSAQFNNIKEARRACYERMVSNVLFNKGPLETDNPVPGSINGLTCHKNVHLTLCDGIPFIRNHPTWVEIHTNFLRPEWAYGRDVVQGSLILPPVFTPDDDNYAQLVEDYEARLHPHNLIDMFMHDYVTWWDDSNDGTTNITFPDLMELAPLDQMVVDDVIRFNIAPSSYHYAPKMMQGSQAPVAPAATSSNGTGSTGIAPNLGSGADAISSSMLPNEMPITGSVGPMNVPSGAFEFVTGEAMSFPEMTVNFNNVFTNATRLIYSDKFTATSAQASFTVIRTWAFGPDSGNIYGKMLCSLHDYFDIINIFKLDLSGPQLQQGCLAFSWVPDITPFKKANLTAEDVASLSAFPTQLEEVRGNQTITFNIKDVRNSDFNRKWVYTPPTATTAGSFTMTPAGAIPGVVCYVYQPFANNFQQDGVTLTININEHRAFDPTSMVWGLTDSSRVSKMYNALIAKTTALRLLPREGKAIEGQKLINLLRREGIRGDTTLALDSTSIYNPVDDLTMYTPYKLALLPKTFTEIAGAFIRFNIVPSSYEGMEGAAEGSHPEFAYDLHEPYEEAVDFTYTTQRGDDKFHTYREVRMSKKGEFFHVHKYTTSMDEVRNMNTDVDQPQFIGTIKGNFPRLPATPGGMIRVVCTQNPPFTVPETFDAQPTMCQDFTLHDNLHTEYSRLDGEGELQFSLLDLQNQLVGTFRFNPTDGLYCKGFDQFAYHACRLFPEDLTISDVRKVPISEPLPEVKASYFRSRKSGSRTDGLWVGTHRDGPVYMAESDTYVAKAAMAGMIGAQAAGSALSSIGNGLMSMHMMKQQMKFDREMAYYQNNWQSGENALNRDFAARNAEANRRFNFEQNQMKYGLSAAASAYTSRQGKDIAGTTYGGKPGPSTLGEQGKFQHKSTWTPKTGVNTSNFGQQANLGPGDAPSPRPIQSTSGFGLHANLFHTANNYGPHTQTNNEFPALDNTKKGSYRNIAKNGRAPSLGQMGPNDKIMTGQANRFNNQRPEHIIMGNASNFKSVDNTQPPPVNVKKRVDQYEQQTGTEGAGFGGDKIAEAAGAETPALPIAGTSSSSSQA